MQLISSSTRNSGSIYRAVLLVLLSFIMVQQPNTGLANTAASLDQTSVLFFFPTHKKTKASGYSDFDILKQIPPSAWKYAQMNKKHYGFQHQKIFMKINPSLNKTQNVLVIEDRYLHDTSVQAIVDNTIEKKQAEIALMPRISVGFKSARLYHIPKNTSQIQLVGHTTGPLIIPFQFITQSQADRWILSATWSLGIFFGVAFISLLICGFHFLVLQQKSLGLICCLIFSLSVYIISKSNLHFITYFPIQHLNTPGVQVFILSCITLCALYTQYFSNEHLISQKPSPLLQKLFKTTFLFIITPLMAYFFVPQDQFRISTFQILHLPSLVLGFIIAAISSSLSHKRNLEQGYLLLTWVFLGASLMIEGSEFLGIHAVLLLPIDSVTDLPGIFTSLALIFLAFWCMNHSALVQKIRTEAIQNLFDGVTEKNKFLEMNHAQLSNMTQDILRKICTPTHNIIKIIHSTRSEYSWQDDLTAELTSLETSLEKLMSFQQELEHPISTQSIPFRVHSLFNRIQLVFAEKASAQHVKIHLEIDQLLPTYAVGDQSLLYKAIFLIIEHRLHTLNHATLHIFSSRQNDPRSPHIQLRVRIEDNGVPFHKNALHQLWSHSPTFKNHDFQLLLAQDMVSAMGGEFNIEYDTNTGNCFSIQVMLSKHHQPSDTTHEASAIHELIPTPLYHSKNALIFNELTTALPTLQAHLTVLGIKIHVAKNLQEVSTTAFIEKPHVIFFEINTAHTCEQVIQKLKHIQDLDHVPMICLSVDDTLETHALLVGATYFLHSPPSLSSLQKSLSKAFGV